MFSIIVKGERDPKDADAVKLTLVVYRTGYVRKKKLLLISGAYHDWDAKGRCFKPDSADNISKNKLIQQERIKFLKIAEKWEYSGKNWDPLELIHHFDAGTTNRNRSVYVVNVIDQLIGEISERKRIRNGQEFSGAKSAVHFATLKRSLIRFTRNKYNRDFTKYRFRDINSQFLVDFHLEEQRRGQKNSNTGGADRKIKLLLAVYGKARESDVYGADTSVFDSVKLCLRQSRYFSKAVPPEIIIQLEDMDRRHLLKREQLYLDLFLFSYYAGGMSAIDVCHMEKSWIRSGTIEYERTKYPNKARVVLSDKATNVIEKYRKDGYMNYVFPVFKKRDMSISRRMSRIGYINKELNQLLKKICTELNIAQKITWSTARSTFIARMVDAGYPVMQICEMTGNSPATIHRHYYAVTDIHKMKTQMNTTF